MFKFTRKYQNDKVKKLQESKTIIYNCLTTYKKKIEMYDFNDSLQSKDYITCVLVISACKKEIQLLEKEIKGINTSLASTYRKKNVSKTDLKVTANGDNLTISEASSTVVKVSNSCQNSSRIGLGLNRELVVALRKQKAKLVEENIEDIPALNGYHQQILDSDLKKEEENKPNLFQQQLLDQITKLKNRNKIQEVNLTENSLVASGATVVHNKVMDSNQVPIYPAQQQKLDNNLTADCQLFLLGASNEISDDGDRCLKHLSMILEDKEDDDDKEADMARCISVIRKEELSSLRKSIISIKSEFGLDEEASLCEFEKLEQMIAKAEAENAALQQPNPKQKLIADDLPISQLFFKSSDSNVTVRPAPECYAIPESARRQSLENCIELRPASL